MGLERNLHIDRNRKTGTENRKGGGEWAFSVEQETLCNFELDRKQKRDVNSCFLFPCDPTEISFLSQIPCFSVLLGGPLTRAQSQVVALLIHFQLFKGKSGSPSPSRSRSHSVSLPPSRLPAHLPGDLGRPGFTWRFRLKTGAGLV